MSNPIINSTSSPYQTLYRLGGASAIIIALLIPLQAIVYIISPPPTAVADFFALFQQNRLLGMMDLDFLMIIDQVLMIPILLALYLAIRRTNESWMLLGMALAFIGMAAYFASREATVTMIALSDGYAAATSDAVRTAFLGAGQAVLASYNGTAFHISYNLGQAAGVIISVVMLRSKLFGRVAPWGGILGNLVGWGLYVPEIGIYISLFSVVGLWIWYFGVARGLLLLSPRDSSSRESRQAQPQVV